METEEESERLVSEDDRKPEVEEVTSREDDVSQYLLERVYFAARDGFPLTLHALLTEQPPHRLHLLLNTVLAHLHHYCVPFR